MSWLFELFRRKSNEQRLDSELRFHLEQQTKDNIAAGMSPEMARREAAIELGGLEQIKEECRDERSGAWLGHISQDIRFGLRMLRKNPPFTAIAVLSLAIGIGAATSAFWLFDAIFLGSLPVPSPQDLQLICWSGSDTHFRLYFNAIGEPDVPGRKSGSSFSKEVFFSLRKQCAAQADIFAYGPLFCKTARAKGKSVLVEGGQIVSGNFFSGLGVRPLLGKLLGPEDESATGTPRVVISYSLWDRVFGLDTSAIGQQINVNGTSYSVVGVLPRDFTGVNPGSRVDLFVSLSPNSSPTPDMPAFVWAWPDGCWLALMGRMMPGVSNSQLKAVLDVSLISAVGTSITKPAGLIVDGHDGAAWSRVDFRNKLRLLLAVVGVVVVAACVNIAGLLMARGAARQHELSVRKALGAGRWRLFRQLFTESALISLLGGGLGILLALWGRIAVSRFLNGTPEGVQFGTPLDLKVLGFALAITVLTMFLCGILPALMSTSTDPKYGLRNRSAVGAPRLRAGKILVAAQIALSLLLVTGAGLYTRTLINLDRIDPGYAMDHLLFLNLDPGLSGYTGPRTVTYYENVQRSLSAIPGVQSAALVSYPLLSGVNWKYAFTIPDLPVDRKDTSAQQLIVSENFFATIGIPILNGREFRASDRDGTSKVIVINEAFVRKFFSGRVSVGRTIKSGDDVLQIVGVCRDTSFIDIKKAIEPTIYFPYRQSSNGSSSFALRTAGSPISVAEEARRVATAMDPEVPVTDLRSQVQLRDQNIATERACARYYGSLAVFVLLLSCMGLYGLMAFDVTRRTDELGIRLALGATPHQIVGPILQMALLLAFAGLVSGLPLTLALTRFVRASLYGVTASDPMTFLGSVTLLVMVMLVAAWIPARRATRVDPMVALRRE